MKKIILSFFSFAVLAATLFAQPCTPDPALTSPGFSPDSTVNLPAGTVDVYYEAVISAFIPADTVIDLGLGPIPIDIDSIGVVNVIGLPSGLTWVSNSATNFWPGGQKGCIKIQGTTSLQGVHNLIIPLSIHAKLGGMPVIETDTIFFYEIDMQLASVAEFANEQFSVGKAFPNPALDVTNIEIITSKPTVVQYALYNIVGTQVTQSKHNLSPGLNTITLSVKQYPAGMYFYKISNGETVITRKLNVSK
jgi:hypothetical protein